MLEDSYVYLGFLDLTLPVALPRRPVPGDRLLPEQLSQNGTPPDDEILSAIHNALLDKTSNMFMAFERGSGKRNVRIGISVRPMEKIKKSEGWSDRWSENMGVILSHLKVEGNVIESPFLQVDPSEEVLHMPRIYANIDSPPEPHFPDPSPVQRRLMSMEAPEMITTKMYRWQLRSLARMMQLEERVNRIPDPEYYPRLEDETGKQYYINSRTWELTAEPNGTLLEFPKGGILAEAMGSGKTLVALALIVSTRDRHAQPPSDAPARPGLSGSGGVGWSWKVNTRELVQITGKKFARPKTMYMSQSTLIVVPGLLVNHWADEISKHVNNTSGLKVRCIRTNSIPSRDVLLGNEVLKYDYHWSIASIYWKRLIFDEGSFAGVEADLDSIRHLRADSRWLVSGMLTDNLRQGIGGMDLATTPFLGPYDEEAEVGEDSESVVSADPGHTDLPINESEQDKKSESDDDERLGYTEYDYDDLKCLGNMIGLALGAEQGYDSFRDSLCSMLDGKKRKTMFGVVYRITEIMQAILVKHREHQIELESTIKEPPDIQHLSIALDPLQRLSYNVCVAGIKLNGIDYNENSPFNLLNAKKPRAHALEITQLSTLWYIAPDMPIKQLLSRAYALTIEDEDDPSITDEDKACAKEAERQVSLARTSKEWKTHMDMATPSALFQLTWTDDRIQRAFCDVVVATGEKKYMLAEAVIVSFLKQFNRCGAKYDRLVELGAGQIAAKKAQAKVRIQAAKDSGYLEETEREKSRKLADAKSQGKGKSARRRRDRAAADKMEADKQQNRKKLEGNQEIPGLSETDQPGRSRPCATETMAICRSGKISKVIQLLQASAGNDRFVIFGTGGELGFVAEVLRVIDVKFVSVLQDYMSSGQRSTGLDSYKTDSTIKVLLLEPACGATGLDLTCANKMIFLSECWTMHEINQGIKRIHRNGQLRPTTVYILIAKDTFEDFAGGVYPPSVRRKWQERILRYPRYCSSSAVPTYSFNLKLTPPVYNQPDAQRYEPDSRPDQLGKRPSQHGGKRKAIEEPVVFAKGPRIDQITTIEGAAERVTIGEASGNKSKVRRTK